MSIFTALTGISAAQDQISVTSHNIANASTAGFKKSRALFADIFPSSPSSVMNTAIGSGVSLSGMSQTLSQGNLIATGNILDMAIEGFGHFAVMSAEAASQEAEIQYTRDGAFSRAVDGKITTAQGKLLLGLPVANSGEVLSFSQSALRPIVVPPVHGENRATGNIKISLKTSDFVDGNSPSRDSELTTAIQIYDANGASATSFLTFKENGDPSFPDLHYLPTLEVGGHELPLVAATPIDNELNNAYLFAFGGDQPINVEVSFEVAPASGAGLEIESFSQDGTPSATLKSLTVDGSGVIRAGYSNGEDVPIAALAIANFSNPHGLRQLGGNLLGATEASGTATWGAPGSNGTSSVRSGNLERSNTELTEELVELITAQRNYQASSKALEVSMRVGESIMNIRV